jgi:metallo-beta-lactamase family protein
LVGYQAAGTRGQHLLSGATSIKMFGKWIDVRAEIVQIEEFSVHADSQELLNWFKSADTVPKAIFAVHGESESADTFAKLINEELGWNSIVPKLELSYELN